MAIMSEIQKPRWYSVDKDGAATLCVDEEDAKQVAAESFVAYPLRGPYTAVQMQPMPPEWRAAVLAAADAVAASLFTGVVTPGSPPLVLGGGTKAAYDAARARLIALLGGAA